MSVMTYHSVQQSGKIAKSHLNTFLTALRRRYSGVNYLWIAEFQRRGSLHFHIFTDCEINAEWLLETWSRISGQTDDRLANRIENGCSWVERLRKPHALVWYCLKEVSKSVQKVLPEGVKGIGRWWGSSRSDVMQTHVCHSENVPFEAIEDIHEILSEVRNKDSIFGRITLCRSEISSSILGRIKSVLTYWNDRLSSPDLGFCPI